MGSRVGITDQRLKQKNNERYSIFIQAYISTIYVARLAGGSLWKFYVYKSLPFGSVRSNKLSNVGNLLDFPSIYLWTNPIAFDTANKKIKVADMCLQRW